MSSIEVVATNDAGDGAATLARMAVRVGELGLLFSWDGGREVMPAPAASHIPNTVGWLRGVANVRGALVPVIDTATAFGVARATGVPSYLLICGGGDDAMGLLIDGLPRVLDVDAAHRLPDRPSTTALLDRGVLDAYERDGRIWLDVDLNFLFEALAGEAALA
jgi:chemotaxis signal transduction protein